MSAGMQTAFASVDDIRGIDVTSSYLVNPSFENEDTFEGWELDNFTNEGSSTGAQTQVRLEKEKGVGYFDGTEAIEKWVSHGGSLGTFTVYQTVADLPKGKYQISVGAKGMQQSSVHEHVEGLSLFANASNVRISTPLLEDFSNSLRNNNEPISEFFIIDVEIEEGEDLIFGFRGEETTANWICFDNFRIYLVEADNMIAAYQAQIEEALSPYANPEVFKSVIVGEYRTPLGASGKYATAYAELKTNASATQDDYYDLYQEILAAISLAESSKADMKTLYDLYGQLDGLYSLGFDEELLYDFEDGCIGALDGTDATMEEVLELIASFDKVAKDYILSGAETANADNAANFTLLVANPTIEKGTASGDYNKIDGWNCWNEGGNGRYLCFDNNNVALEAWGSTPANINFDYNQEITGLPEGLYTVKAKARGSQTALPNGNAVIYGAGVNEKQTGIYNSYIDNGGLAGGETSDDINDGTMVQYVVDGIFVEEGGTLRFGAKNIGELSCNWTLVDDFELFYIGNENPEANYLNALNDRIADAELVLEKEMLVADKLTLTSAILDAKEVAAKDGLTVEDVKTAVGALIEATEKANEAVSLLSDFHSGVYKTVSEFSCDFEEINQMMANIVVNVDEVLADAASNVETLEAFNTQLNSAISFANAFIAAQDEMNGDYTAEALIEFDDALNAVLELMKDGDLANLELANSRLVKAIWDIRNSALVTGSDYTAWVINPGFEDGFSGWVNDGMATQNNDGFSDKTDTYYCEKWVSSGSNIPDVSVYQTVLVPNGIYSISVDASATQGDNSVIEGVNLVLCDGDWAPAKGVKAAIEGQYLVEPVIGDDPNYIPQVDDNGDVIDTEIPQVALTPGELTYTVTVDSHTGKISFGIVAENATCNYLRFDNFKLAYAGIPAGIEDVTASKDAFFVVVEGKQIKVYGVEDYKVFSVNGQEVSAKADLATGIYIVTANGKSVKVAIK